MAQYFVLPSFDPDLADDPFHEAFGGVIDRFGDDHGIYVVPIGRTETDIQIVVPWADESKSIELTMYDNYLVMTRHLELRGDHPLLEELGRRLRDALDLFEPQAHLEDDDAALAAQPTVVFQVALAAPEHPEPGYVAFLERALAHGEATVRHVAAQAVNLLGWGPSLDALQSAYATERPGQTKATMATVLRAWERIG